MARPIRQGDRLPTLRAVAFTATGVVDFTQFVSISFRMVNGETVVTGPASGDASGNLSYAWASGDTDVPGTYAAVFIAVDGTGRQETFPTDSNIEIVIIPAI